MLITVNHSYVNSVNDLYLEHSISKYMTFVL